MKKLVIHGVSIRQNTDGLYLSNDLHKASCALDAKRPEVSSQTSDETSKKANAKRPQYFLRNDRTQRFLGVLDGISGGNEKAGFPAFYQTAPGVAGGTFMCKELLIQYASWLSPEIDLAVTRAFIEKMEQAPLTPNDILKLQVEFNEITEKEVKRLGSVVEDISVRMDSQENAQNTLNQQFLLGEYMTVKAHCAMSSISVTKVAAAMLGKRCVRECALQGLVVRKQHDHEYGTINKYPTHIVKSVVGGWLASTARDVG